MGLWEARLPLSSGTCWQNFIHVRNIFCSNWARAQSFAFMPFSNWVGITRRTKVIPQVQWRCIQKSSGWSEGKPKVVVHYANEETPSRCFITLCKSKSPAQKSEDAFYLQPLKNPSKDCWFSGTPIGHYTLAGTRTPVLMIFMYCSNFNYIIYPQEMTFKTSIIHVHIHVHNKMTANY